MVWRLPLFLESLFQQQQQQDARSSPYPNRCFPDLGGLPDLFWISRLCRPSCCPRAWFQGQGCCSLSACRSVSSTELPLPLSGCPISLPSSFCRVCPFRRRATRFSNTTAMVSFVGMVRSSPLRAPLTNGLSMLCSSLSLIAVTLITAGVLHYFGYFSLASIGDNLGSLTTGRLHYPIHLPLPLCWY